MTTEKELTPDQKYKMEQVLFRLKQNKKNFVKRYGKKAEDFMRKRAIKIAKQHIPEEPMSEEMKNDRLKKLVQDALSKPLEEKKKPFPDLTGDGKVTKADILKGRGVIDEYESDAELIADEPISEDIDLGHEDDEPHMIKGELYKIAQNAIALYKMLEPFDKLEQEVDLPAWWQSKITKACTMLGSAKTYLEFELKEPQIDAMADTISLDEKMSKKQIKKRGEIYDALKDQGMSDEKAGRIATAKAQKIKEAVLAKLKESKK